MAASAASASWDAGWGGSPRAAIQAMAVATAETAKLPNSDERPKSGSNSSGSAVAGVQVRLNLPIAERISAPCRPAVR